MFLEESLYGWGACDIRMPRAANGLYSQRQKTASHPWRTASILRIFVDDCPWGEALLLSLLSAVVLALTSLINNALPKHQDEQLSKHVDIVISMIKEDQMETSPLEEEPLPTTEPDYVEQKIVSTEAAEEPQQIIVTEPPKRKQTIYREKQHITPEETFPELTRKPRIIPKRTERSQPLPSTTFAVERQPEQEEITILPPAFHRREPTKTDSDKILPPIQSNVVTEFVPPENQKPAVSMVPADRHQKVYNSEMLNPEESRTPHQITATDLLAFNRPDEKAEIALPQIDQQDHRHTFEDEGSRHPVQAVPPSTDQHVSFQHRNQKENLELEPRTVVRSFSKRSDVLRSVPAETTRATDLPRLRQPSSVSEAPLPKRQQSQKSYVLEKNGPYEPKASKSANQSFSFQPQKREEKSELEPRTAVRSFSKRSDARHSVPAETTRATDLPRLRQPSSVSEVPLPKRQQSQKSYVLQKNGPYRPKASQSMNQRFSFQPQKREENLVLAPPAIAKSISKNPKPLRKSSTPLAKAPQFSAGDLPDDIEPSQLISLKTFKVCTDPEEEFRLKTKLAVQLDGPSRFGAGGVLFFCKYTESGYTMQVDIYDPQERVFKDRCEVLQLAIDGLVNNINLN